MKKVIAAILFSASFVALIVSIILIPVPRAKASDQFTQFQCVGGSYTNSGYLKQGIKVLSVWTSGSFAGGLPTGNTLASSIQPFTIAASSQNYFGDIYYTVTGGTLFTIECR